MTSDATTPLTPAEREVLAKRSDKNKIGVPVDRSLVPPHQLAALHSLLSDRRLVWLDSEKHPAGPRRGGLACGSVGWTEIDIYLVTPAGMAAMAAADA